MPFQPCGYLCDWARRPFTAMCRFTTDVNTPPGKIIFWGTKGPALPFPSLFNNRWWNTEDIGAFALGGQVPRPRGYNGRWFVPGAVYGHFCGTADMFMNGYDPSTNPPTPPGPGVIPPCCPMAKGGFVGAAAWPTSVVKSWSGPTYKTFGGYTVGGPGPRVSVARQLVVGGYRVGGFIQSTVSTARAPSGGYRVGGVVQNTVSTARAPSGGYRVGGVVQNTVSTARAPSGGYRVGGSVPFSLSTTIPASGGYAVGGVVPFRMGLVRVPSGGYAVGGVVPFRMGLVRVPSGGYAVGGFVQRIVGPSSGVGVSGGYRVGGSIAASAGPVVAPSGGYRVGGSVSYSVAPPAPLPGATCATAGVFSVGVTYNETGPSGAGNFQWLKWVLPNGTHAINFTGLTPPGSQIAVYYLGSSCTSLGGAVGLASSPTVLTVTNGVLWVRVNNPGAAAPYSIEVS